MKWIFYLNAILPSLKVPSRPRVKLAVNIADGFVSPHDLDPSNTGNHIMRATQASICTYYNTHFHTLQGHTLLDICIDFAIIMCILNLIADLFKGGNHRKAKYILYLERFFQIFWALTHSVTPLWTPSLHLTDFPQAVRLLNNSTWKATQLTFQVDLLYTYFPNP